MFHHPRNSEEEHDCHSDYTLRVQVNRTQKTRGHSASQITASKGWNKPFRMLPEAVTHLSPTDLHHASLGSPQRGSLTPLTTKTSFIPTPLRSLREGVWNETLAQQSIHRDPLPGLLICARAHPPGGSVRASPLPAVAQGVGSSRPGSPQHDLVTTESILTLGLSKHHDGGGTQEEHRPALAGQMFGEFSFASASAKGSASPPQLPLRHRSTLWVLQAVLQH